VGAQKKPKGTIVRSPWAFLTVYSGDGNRLVSTTDASGKVTTYSYHPDTNVLEWVQYPEDTDGTNSTTDTRTKYTYDSMYRMVEAEVLMNIIADHLGFCRDCYTTHFYDKDDLDEDGNTKRKPKRKVPFIELAAEHGFASPRYGR